MENAQIISLSRQMALRRQMDVVANNIANMNTAGFKAETILFEDVIQPKARDYDFRTPDQRPSFTTSWGTIHDLTAGSIEQTGNPLDVALNGQGYLVVQTPAGERYTRDGSLSLDASGTLVNRDGYPVLADGGPVTFAAAETGIRITPDGSMSSSAGLKGKLRLVEFPNPQALLHEGRNLLSGGTPQAATATRVVQGAIERSNVSGVEGMTEMIRVQRAYESTASMMDRQDEIRRSAIQKLANVNA